MKKSAGKTKESGSAGISPSIRLLVDAPEGAAKGSNFGLPQGIGAVSQKIVEVGGEAFRSSVASIVSSVAEALEGVDLSGKAYELGDAKFVISFDAGGEVSIISLAKGSVSGKTGIEVTIRRRLSS